MDFDWRSYVQLAREWYEGEPEPRREQVLRAVVSRAYYGTFCAVRNWARESSSFEPRYSADDHGRLRAHLKQHRAVGLAHSLEQLRDARNDCDYSDVIVHADDSAIESLERAEDALKWLT